MATYDHEGETYFALSLKADLASDVGPCDIVVLFDTSASQSGVYRDDSFAAFQSMLDQLNKQHNVRLYALDLEAVPMGSQFAAVGSSELKQSIAQLNARLPLGSTDMIAGLKTAWLHCVHRRGRNESSTLAMVSAKRICYSSMNSKRLSINLLLPRFRFPVLRLGRIVTFNCSQRLPTIPVATRS
jgi:hypothetical protein